ncbi:hypothetical protein ACH4F6_31780 [Streptomyces sp. NPDC017936]|uniref:hypothetical protein n=1 Tax=Streptomyces sp. NPDC017936 TaxID=3365016 RepID=UPI00378BA681
MIRGAADLDARAAEQGTEEAFAHVVGPDGPLRLAPRRSEHGACAGGGDVLGAGEITVRRADRGRRVEEVGTRSTGCRPDPGSWPAVAAAPDRAGVRRPDGSPHALVFRRCERRGEHDVVRGSVFVRVFRDAGLPRSWNVDVSRP